MIIGATRMCEVLVGLRDVNVLGVVDVAGAPVLVVIRRELLTSPDKLHGRAGRR